MNESIHPVLFVTRLIVGIVKLPTFVLVFTLSFFYYSIALIIPIVEIRATIIKVVSRVCFRILLILTGNWSVTKEIACKKETTLGAGAEKEVKPGDVIISNFGSYLNLFWFQKEFCPTFVIPCGNYLRLHSFYSLFLSIMSGDQMVNGEKFTLCEAVTSARESGFPLVVFPEGVLSDCTSVLEFRDFIQDSSYKDISFHIMGFIHRGRGVSPNYTKGNSFFHLIRMIGRSIASMKVRIAAANEIPAFEDDKMTWLRKCRKCLSDILRIPLYNKLHTD